MITGLGMNYHSRQWIFRKTPEFPHTSAKHSLTGVWIWMHVLLFYATYDHTAVRLDQDILVRDF